MLIFVSHENVVIILATEFSIEFMTLQPEEVKV